nr:unnamed protein product [Callosobruchus analis]
MSSLSAAGLGLTSNGMVSTPLTYSEIPLAAFLLFAETF